MLPLPVTAFPPQEVWTSVDSGETYPLEWWWNNYVLSRNPDGTITADTKYSRGIPPMTLRQVSIMASENEEVIKVGCKDPHSVDYCVDCEVKDNSKCGVCKSGYTRTEDGDCWKIGYRVVDCKTNDIYYGPLGYYQNCDIRAKDKDGLCYIQDPEHYRTFGSVYDTRIYGNVDGKGRLRTDPWIKKKWGTSDESQRYQYVSSDGTKRMYKSSPTWNKVKENCGGEVTLTRVDTGPTYLGTFAGQNNADPKVITIDNNQQQQQTNDGMQSQIEPETPGFPWLWVGLGGLAVLPLFLNR